MVDTVYYRMSEAGDKPYPIYARRIGIQSTRTRTEQENHLLQYATYLENVVRLQMLDEGFTVEFPPQYCPQCLKMFGEKRGGIHVEIPEGLFTFIGHMDGKILIDNIRYPIEVKSLGRFSFNEFRKSLFAKFFGYAGQEACYLHAENKPGLYWVLNRDSGENFKLVVNDTNNVLNIPGFIKTILPMTYEQVLDNHIAVEMCILEGKEPECHYDDEECKYCNYISMCPDKPKIKEIQTVSSEELLVAADKYKTAKAYEEIADEMKQSAVNELLKYAKSESGSPKFHVGGIGFTYSEERTKSFLDENLIRTEAPDLYKRALKQSKPFPSYTVRLLKEG